MLAASAGASHQPSATGQIYFYEDVTQPINSPVFANPLVVTPSALFLSGNGIVALVDLHWGGWDSIVARATGVISTSSCNPNCATGRRTNRPIQFTLSSPGRVLGHEVYRCFQLTVPSYPQSDQYQCLGPLGKLYGYVPVNRPSPVTAGAVCSTATARILIDQHGLNGFLLPPAQVLCGPFTGPGSEAMAVTVAAATCWSPQAWAVFSFSGGTWKLVFVQRAFIVPPLVAVGANIKVTTPVFRTTDHARCLPTGGTRARLWSWDGTTLTPGPWHQVTPGQTVPAPKPSPVTPIAAPVPTAVSKGVALGLTGPLAILKDNNPAGIAVQPNGKPSAQVESSYGLDLVTTAGHLVARVTAKALIGLNADYASTPLLSIISASADRLYYLDAGGVVRVLDPNGKTRVAAKLPDNGRTLFGIAASPDDRTLAVSALEFTFKPQRGFGGSTVLAAGYPVHERLYTQDLRTGRRHEVFSATASSYGGLFRPVWPLGWRGDALVLAVGAVGQQQMPLNPYDAWDGYQVVSSVDGTRLTSVCSSGGGGLGPIVPAGTVCGQNPRAFAFQAWDGTCSAFPVSSILLGGVEPPRLAPSPDGAYLALFSPTEDGIVLLRHGQESYRNLSLPGAPLGWLDRTHLVVGSRPGETSFGLGIYDLTAQRLTPVTLPSQLAKYALGFVGVLPGGLGAPAPTKVGVSTRCG